MAAAAVAVFFIGMSCWGSQRVSELELCWGHILPSLAHVTSCGHAIVIFEVILSLQRLVKKYGTRIVVEWTIILDMLTALLPWLKRVSMPLMGAITSTTATVRDGDQLDEGSSASMRLTPQRRQDTFREESTAKRTTFSSSAVLTAQDPLLGPSHPHEIIDRIASELLDTVSLIETLAVSVPLRFNGDLGQFYTLSEALSTYPSYSETSALRLCA